MAYHPAFVVLLVALPAALLALRLVWPKERPPHGSAVAWIFLAPLAAALLATLLAALAAQVLAPRAEPIPRSTLLGEWEIYNDSDSQLIGFWCFEKAKDEGLTVRLIVYPFKDPHALETGQRSLLRASCSHEQGTELTTIPAALDAPPIYPLAPPEEPVRIGPFPISRDRFSGVLEFDYRSPWGCGHARLSPAWGFFGTYRRETDGGAAHGSDEPEDTEEITVLREGESAYRRERAALRWIRAGVVGSVWLALALAALVGRIGRGLPMNPWFVRLGVLGVAVVLAVAGYRLLARPPHVFDEGVARGDWHIEYVSNRDFAANVEWVDEGGEPRLHGTLRRRGEPQGGTGIDATVTKLDGHGTTPFDHSARLEYSTGADHGVIDLREVPAMTGPFHDHRLDLECPGGNDLDLNYGDFIAFKRPEAR